MNKKSIRMALGVSSLAVCAVTLAGCGSANAPQAIQDASSTHKVGSTSVGDDPNGCQEIQPTNDHGTIWTCNYSGGQAATITVPAGENIGRK